MSAATPSPLSGRTDDAERPPRLGALPGEEGVRFRCWAPGPDRLELVLEEESPQILHMEQVGAGYYERFVPRLDAGTRYRYRLDGEESFPDPAARFQPGGVHGPSEVIDPAAYAWEDEDWSGVSRDELVFYELHVGTFTPEGTFAAARERLGHLGELGVTAVELMPVAQFPGRWNWGYDQGALYAPCRTYGRPEQLRLFVDAAHREGLAVFLDVIYNHLGPDGSYLPVYGPVFTDRHRTPWGRALNMDGPGSEGVRDFFLDNALHWLEEYRLDGLRLDATFEIHDEHEPHFLTELTRTVADCTGGPPRTLIAEDPRDLNVLVRPREEGGHGLDGVWVDDFHHQVRNLTAGDRHGYFASYRDSTMREIAETVRRGWYFDGRIDPATGEPRGSDPAGVHPDQCVYCIQNHDQVGNRPMGERLTEVVSPAVYRTVSALLLFVPELPLLFMGQEWGASTPFLYFTDHEPELGARVREGRREEFAHWDQFEGTVPDPQDEETFRGSRLDWSERSEPAHARIHRLYRDLLDLRSGLSGCAEPYALSEGSLLVRRGDAALLLTVDDGAVLDLSAADGVRLGPVRWHSERAAYAVDPRPADRDGERVRFARPGALVARIADLASPSEPA